MSLIKVGKGLFIFLSIAFISQWAYKYYLTKNNKKKRKEVREIHEALMFCHGAGQLKRSKYSRCVVTESMDRLLFYVNSPKYTLDICMYVLTNLDLAQIILKQHFKGVKIRIIVDADMAFASGSHVRKFEKQGIPVRWMKSSNLMHHKFTLIDASSGNPEALPVVIMGSLNWTNQALSGNWEDVAITSQRELVEQYRYILCAVECHEHTEPLLASNISSCRCTLRTLSSRPRTTPPSLDTACNIYKRQ